MNNQDRFFVGTWQASNKALREVLTLAREQGLSNDVNTLERLDSVTPELDPPPNAKKAKGAMAEARIGVR
jgi:hypothetical protein